MSTEHIGADEAQDETLSGRRMVRLLGSLAFGHSFIHFCGHAFVVLMAEVVSSLGLPPSAAGIIMASRSMGGAISQFPMGMLADRFADRRTLFMTAALLWFGAFYFFIGFASDLVTIAILAAFLGFGGALWHPPAIGLISTRMPERRAFGMAMHGIGAGAGDTLGPLVVGGLLLAFTWQAIFKMALIPGLLFALVFFLLMRGFATGSSRGHTSMADYFNALGEAARHRPLLLSVVAGSTRTGGQMILLAFVPLYALEDLGLSKGLVGAVASLLLGLSLVSQPVLAYISDRIGRKYTVLPTAALLTILGPCWCSPPVPRPCSSSSQPSAWSCSAPRSSSTPRAWTSRRLNSTTRSQQRSSSVDLRSVGFRRWWQELSPTRVG
ncbi:MAG: MFS transporter [Chloroflexi bacterium]|nr:MFS transporter [Chloroflexota bacterium]